MSRFRALSTTAAALLLAGAFPAVAAGLDDRFEIRVAAMDTQGSAKLSAAGGDAQFGEVFDLGGKKLIPRFDGVLRLGNRNRVIFDYFNFSKSAHATLSEDVALGDEVVPAGSSADLDAGIRIASLIYDFSLVERDAFSLGLQLGAEWAKLDATARAEAGDMDFHAEAREDGIAPLVGLRLTASPGERWLISAQAQHLDAGWGNFDFGGKIQRANAIVEYRVTEAFGIFGGYDRFKLRYARSGRDAAGALELEFKGPIVGFSAAF